MDSEMQRMANALQRQLVDNMAMTVSPRVIAIDPGNDDLTSITTEQLQSVAREMALPLDMLKSPPLMPERMFATAMKLKQEEARRSMHKKAFFPELWSNKLLDEFGKSSIFGDLLRADLVGPDWPQYAGVDDNKNRLADIDGRRMVSPRSDHLHDAILYGTSVIKLHATA